MKPGEQFRPIGDNILVKRDKAEAVTGGGIVIPEKAQKKSQQGVVVDIGDGALLDSGERRLPNVHPGDKVAFTAWTSSLTATCPSPLESKAGHSSMRYSRARCSRRW